MPRTTLLDILQAVYDSGTNTLKISGGSGGGGGDASAANQTTEIAKLTSIDNKITAVNTGAVVVSSSALPSGAATSAKQDTGNTSLGSIDGKLPSLMSAAPGSDTGQSAIPVRVISQLGAGTGGGGGGLTDAELRASAVPVSLASLPALAAGTANIGDVDVLTLPALPAGTNNIGDVDIVTMPAITGTVTANAGTGTFAVSGPLTDTQLRASAVPISGTVIANAGTGTMAVSLASLPALAAGTANIGDVDVLTLPALPAGTNNIGDVDVLTLPSIPAGTALIGKVGIDQTTPGTTNKVSIGTDGTVAINAAIPAGNNNIGDVDVASIAAGTNRIGSVRVVDSADADLTSAKGTQTSRAIGVQELKDAGRTNIVWFASAIAAGTTGTETMITMNKSAGTGATTSASSFVITNGKTLRLTSITFATRGHATATAQITQFALRINTGGAVGTTSTPVILSTACATPATSLAWDRLTIPLGDGWEITGNGTIQIGVSANAVYVTNAPTWYVVLTGFEY
jgi:hypothetical protein